MQRATVSIRRLTRRANFCSFSRKRARPWGGPHTHEDGWAFDVEVLAIAREYGLRIVEVPIDWHHDRNSRVRALRDAPSMFAALFRIRARLMMGVPDIPHEEPHRPQRTFTRT